MVVVQTTKAAASAGSTALSKLCQTNVNILTQKLGLLSALTNKHGADMAKVMFQKTCPLVQASIGQHFRHSLDHQSFAAQVAEKPKMGGSGPAELHYDIRERGCTSEHDMDAAAERIVDTIHKLEVASLMSDQTAQIVARQELPVQAYFMLSGDDDTEFALPSSIGRELGFAAHHAIHHMAMVKLIALHTGGLEESDLPVGFGKAPSTQNFENSQ